NQANISGLCLSSTTAYSEMMRRLDDADVGDLVALQANDLRGRICVHPRRNGCADMEWQMRNWYYFTWLSGDFNVEQHVHYLDVCSWLKGEYPVKAVGLGGRQVRTGPEYGQIYDHFSIVYEYADETKLFSNCRQMPGCIGDMSCHVFGTKGIAQFRERRR